MQPSMSKVRSLDYSTSAFVGAPSGRKHTPLMHSVSIVVELAHDSEPMTANSSDWSQVNETSEKRTHEEDEEDEEEVECLAGSLARRVVIVDEADKIQRARARSAEPEVSLATNSASFLSGLDKAGEQVAECSGSGARVEAGGRGSRWLGGPRKQSSGACELAEHGELSQLGMRRNTCHQMTTAGPHCAGYSAQEPAQKQPASGAPSEYRHTRSGSAQLADSLPLTTDPLKHGAPANKSSVVGPTVAAIGGLGGTSQNSLRNRCHQQQRRRSLQISFLSGGPRTGPGSNQLLREEELWGERQFNEHLRSLRSSADWTTARQDWNSWSSEQQRCKSVDTGPTEQEAQLGVRQTPTEWKFFAAGPWQAQELGRPTTGAQKQQARRHSPRRVSFCSVHPPESSNCNRNPNSQLPDTTLKRHSVVVAPDSDRCHTPEAGPSRAALGEEQLPPRSAAMPVQPEKGSSPGARKSRPEQSGHSHPASGGSKDAAGSGGESGSSESSRLQSIMANARQRQEEFARLLEEHEEIVNEINRVETKISNSQQASSDPVPASVGSSRGG